MSKLTKEEVISTLQNALSEQQNKAVTIEQKGSWYKIDGGKSIRFSELETMLEEIGDAQTAAPAVNVTETPEPKKEASKAEKPAAKKASSGGKTPKELWREKLAAEKGRNTLPQGF